MQGSFTVGGYRVRTESQRRFVAWIVSRNGVYYPEIFKRSDSLTTLRTHIQRRGWQQSSYIVVIDTTTGEEVRA
jgi:hypothetical protein